MLSCIKASIVVTAFNSCPRAGFQFFCLYVIFLYCGFYALSLLLDIISN